MKGKINNNEKWFEVYVLKLFSNFSNNVKLQLIRVNSFINISKRYFIFEIFFKFILQYNE